MKAITKMATSAVKGLVFSAGISVIFIVVGEGFTALKDKTLDDIL